mmetsp:Transcript_99839/g.257948  ORF Transcript_99839/g.257948 Transcript_99839/m.257948 type:complete len:285 (+) Transcript_99839:183-1037(+)
MVTMATAACASGIGGLARLAKGGLQLLVGVALHGLRVLEPLDELHFLFLHVGHQRVGAGAQQLLGGRAGLVVLAVLLHLLKLLLLQAPQALLLAGPDVRAPVLVGLALRRLAILFRQQELVGLLLLLAHIGRPLLLNPLLGNFTVGLGHVAILGILRLGCPDRLPLILVELFLCSELVRILFPKLRDLLRPLPRLLDLLPGLLLLLLQQRDAVRQELGVKLSALAGLLRPCEVGLRLAAAERASLETRLALCHCFRRPLGAPCSTRDLGIHSNAPRPGGARGAA